MNNRYLWIQPQQCLSLFPPQTYNQGKQHNNKDKTLVDGFCQKKGQTVTEYMPGEATK